MGSSVSAARLYVGAYVLSGEGGCALPSVSHGSGSGATAGALGCGGEGPVGACDDGSDGSQHTSDDHGPRPTGGVSSSGCAPPPLRASFLALAARDPTTMVRVSLALLTTALSTRLGQG